MQPAAIGLKIKSCKMIILISGAMTLRYTVYEKKKKTFRLFKGGQLRNSYSAHSIDGKSFIISARLTW